MWGQVFDFFNNSQKIIQVFKNNNNLRIDQENFGIFTMIPMKYHSTRAASTLIILFSEMLKFSTKIKFKKPKF